MIKCCPDLVEHEEVKPMSKYSGWESKKVPNFKPCIGIMCVAFKNGKCTKYNNEVEIKEDD